jgi:hypothetical protein
MARMLSKGEKPLDWVGSSKTTVFGVKSASRQHWRGAWR